MSSFGFPLVESLTMGKSCSRRDSNPQSLLGMGPQSPRVCQFRHASEITRPPRRGRVKAREPSAYPGRQELQSLAAFSHDDQRSAACWPFCIGGFICLPHLPVVEVVRLLRIYLLAVHHFLNCSLGVYKLRPLTEEATDMLRAELRHFIH